MIRQKTKEFVLIYLVAIIALLGVVAFFSLIDPSITGFAVADNSTNEAINNENLTESVEIITETTTIDEGVTNETTQATNETSKEKGKPEKTEKEKPELNTPPA